VKLEVDHLRIATCIPARWEPYKTRYRYRENYFEVDLS
jgi:cyclic beta-1,2-glucan synthetase